MIFFDPPNKTFNSVNDLGEALKYAGPVARDLGLSFEDTLAILGGLGNVGIQGEMAGTALRRLGVLAATEGGKIKDAFGINVADQSGNLRPLVDILGELTQAASHMPSVERLKILDDIFGKQGITGAGAVGRAAKDIKQLGVELLQVSGTAQKTAAQMDAGLGGASRILLSAIEGIAIGLGDALAPELLKYAKFLTSAADATLGFVKANQNVVVGAVKVAAGVAAAGSALVGIGASAQFASFIFGGVSAVLSPVSALFGVMSNRVRGVLTPLNQVGPAFAKFGITANPLGRRYKYRVVGTRNPTLARNVVAAAAPGVISVPQGVLFRQPIDTHQTAYDRFDISVSFLERNREVGTMTWDADTTGATVDVFVSKESLRRYGIGVASEAGSAAAMNIPKHNGAIGVEEDGTVRGTTIVIPSMRLNVQYKYPPGVVTLQQAYFVASLTGLVNSAPFLGSKPGEVLLSPCGGSAPQLPASRLYIPLGLFSRPSRSMTPPSLHTSCVKLGVRRAELVGM